MVFKNKRTQRKEGLLSSIPGAVAGIKHIQSLEKQIELVDVQQNLAKAQLDLRIEMLKTKSALIQSMVDLDVATQNLRKTFKR